MLCLRFPNWPIQRLRQQQSSDAAQLTAVSAQDVVSHQPVAVYSPLADPSEDRPRRRQDASEVDLKYIRTLFPAARSGPAIVAVSEQAWRQGIRPGMPLAEARSMAVPVVARAASARRKQNGLPEVMFCEWQPLQDRVALTAVAELTRRFAPVVGLDQMPVPDCLMLDITGCGSLFGSESTLAEQLLKELQAAGFRCRIAIADTVAAVWAFTHDDTTDPFRSAGERRAQGGARRGKPGGQDQSLNLPILIMPPGQHEEWLKRLPLSSARLHPSDIGVLSQLGLQTLGQLCQLPREDLPARLSADAVLRVQQLVGLLPETIDPIPEASPVQAEWSSEFSAKNHSDMLQVMEHLIGLVCEQLERRRLGCIRLTCQLRCLNDGESSTQDAGVISSSSVVRRTDDPAAVSRLAAAKPGVSASETHVSMQNPAEQTLIVETVKPTQSAKLLTEIVTLRLEAMKLTLAVDRVHMLATTALLPVGRQKDLFDDTHHFVPTEELSALVSRLNSRLGPDAVLIAREVADVRPEHAVRLLPAVPGLDDEASSSRREDVVHQLVTPAQGDGSLIDRVKTTRPVRLLPVPFLLTERHGDTLLAEGILWQGHRLAIRQITGPERLQTAWWHEDAVQRDYYRIQTEQGPLMWVYRDLGSGFWWLHGVFD